MLTAFTLLSLSAIAMFFALALCKMASLNDDEIQMSILNQS